MSAPVALPASLRVTLPFGHLRMRLSSFGGSRSWGLYPSEDHPNADKPLVSGLIGGADNLTPEGLRDLADHLVAFMVETGGET